MTSLSWEGFGKYDVRWLGGGGCWAKDDATLFNMVSGKNFNNLI